jgi:glycosyltransferase involved in cell wall biosynthesis
MTSESYENKLLKRELNQALNQVETIRQEKIAILNSGTWKVMAPVRKLLRAFRGGKATETTDLEATTSEQYSGDGDGRSFLTGYVAKVLANQDMGMNNPEYICRVADDDSILLQDADIKPIAFYLPQFHPIKENDEWWGKGFTEWRNVTKAVPQFEGHYQPRLAADLGYYDLRLSETIEEQARIAQQYGIYGFCIYYYWFDPKVVLDTPVEIIRNNKELKIPFCLCWANENWTKKWDGHDQDVLLSQEYRDGFEQRFVEGIEKYFADDRYIRVDDKPVLVIYNPFAFSDINFSINKIREASAACGYPEVHILGVIRFPYYDVLRESNLDGFVEFPPHNLFGAEPINHKHEIVGDFTGTVFDYRDIINKKEYLQLHLEKTHKGIFMGWDNSSRTKGGYIFHHYSPTAFGEWMRDISKYTAVHFPEHERYVFINAWNEWAEGTYLEPDLRYGFAALNEVRKAVTETRKFIIQREKKDGANQDSILLIGHDACLAGAQLIFYHIARVLREEMGLEVHILLLDGGALIDDFRQVSDTLRVYSEDLESDNNLQQYLRGIKAKHAILNTVVSGLIIEKLVAEGINCISLIHEMQKVILDGGWADRLRSITEYANHVVFPAKYVLESAAKVIPIPAEKAQIIHQGIYNLNPYIDEQQKAIIRQDVRAEYGIPLDSRIVVCAGTGSLRKGLDLFAACSNMLSDAERAIYFLWVGDPLDEVGKDFSSDKRETVYPRLVVTGWTNNPMRYFAAADLYFLTSREDPFPSTVIEAMYSYLPVIAFDGGGGYTELINEKNGVLVKMEDLTASVSAIQRILSEDETLKSMGEEAHSMITKEFDYKDYVIKLMSLLENTEGEKAELT